MTPLQFARQLVGAVTAWHRLGSSHDQEPKRRDYPSTSARRVAFPAPTVLAAP